MTPAVSVKTGSPTYTGGGGEPITPSPALPEGGTHKGDGVGVASCHPERWVAPDSRISTLPVLGYLASSFPRSPGDLPSPLSGCSSGPAPRPRVENRWAGGLGKEWSRVTMATRETETLCPSSCTVGQEEASSLSPASSPPSFFSLFPVTLPKLPSA